MARRTGFLALVVLVCLPALARSADSVRVERNLIYGMYSGTALLMDVYRPASPNGFGVVYIAGSGWHSSLGYDARPLKESGQVRQYSLPLVEAGYTVFAVNHRAAPRFRYPAAVEDMQRAVRFIRYHAREFGIDSTRIGAAGGSSGGHLALMLGVLDGEGRPDDPDPVNRVSAKVQCVVARAAPSDLLAFQGHPSMPLAVSFLGFRLPRNADERSLEFRTFRDASPIYHVTPDDPPTLLIHGDEDPVVPFAQSEALLAKFREAGVACKLIRVPGGGHGPTFGGAGDLQSYLDEMVSWFDRYLRCRAERM